ncbi:hypothetical protein GWK47_053174 [Chionoecetes opilio]|uniref:Uncharacterized protein n=1 Tax=Chionoecetes opilio TaxID=41210 RepID=A0A8J5CPR0_CHIOP|nr:hypothetical protein GWK47_053174 [Chionoecetes opilio]
MPRCDLKRPIQGLSFPEDALGKGCTTCLVRTVDTDVVVILIGKYHFPRPPASDGSHLGTFGTGKNFMYLDINAICYALGKDRSTGLPMFHSFTGCDTTSAFFGERGKNRYGRLGKAYVEVTEAFNKPHESPLHDCDSELQGIPVARALQTLIIYNKKSKLDSVKEARRELFSQKNRTRRTFPQRKKPFSAHTARSLPSWNLGKPVIILSEASNLKGFGWTLKVPTRPGVLCAPTFLWHPRPAAD